MLIIPAINILGGKCVSLFKGDYNQVTTYRLTPLQQAKQFEQEGASALHVVDLDGAREGRLVNKDVIAEIAKNIQIPLHIGGGMRSKEDIQEVLDVGAEMAIIATRVIDSTDFLQEMIAEFGSDKIMVGLNTKEGKVVIKGRQERTSVSGIDAAEDVVQKGAQWIMYTDVYRDGTLTHPNFDDYDKLVQLLPQTKIIASGGIAKIDHIDTLHNVGVTGVVIGRALYENEIRLADIVSRYSS